MTQLGRPRLLRTGPGRAHHDPRARPGDSGTAPRRDRALPSPQRGHLLRRPPLPAPRPPGGVGAGLRLGACGYWSRRWRGVTQRRCPCLGHAPALLEVGWAGFTFRVAASWPGGSRAGLGGSDDVAPDSAAPQGAVAHV